MTPIAGPRLLVVWVTRIESGIHLFFFCQLPQTDAGVHLFLFRQLRELSETSQPIWDARENLHAGKEAARPLRIGPLLMEGIIHACLVCAMA